MLDARPKSETSDATGKIVATIYQMIALKSVNALDVTGIFIRSTKEIASVRDVAEARLGMNCGWGLTNER
tara:strand:- start:73 stop:282 length:210 start_codon:yes stop_codon:yes gene_type:complete